MTVRHSVGRGAWGRHAPARSLVLILLIVSSTVATGGADSTQDRFRAMLDPIVHAPGATAKVRIERSDPFGGPPDRETGEVWYVAGRGLRYRSDGDTGSDLVVDRAADACLVYRPGENVVYRASFSRAPRRIRRLIEDPDRLLDANVGAESERRSIDGRPRDGFRLRAASLGDSVSLLSAWIAPDPETRLPRWIELVTELDSVRIEFRRWSIRRAPDPEDLRPRVPSDAREEPLDPRSLFEPGESR